ncbi:MAG: hypothetical protein GY730_01445, partial [bacterium]|nr:hypothetical protein [bacterium]
MILLKYKNTLADKLIVPVFFIIFFSIGTFIFNDYGISWDEPFQRNLGKMTYDYIFHNDETLLSHRERFHGQILEAGLYLLEKISFTSSTRQVYLTRHFANFCIFFSGCLFFYLLCKKQFKSRRTALMGVLFLILSPRIFAHAFYNSKDIPFMSIFIISMYTLCLYMENKSFKTAAIHALICALLTATRVLGLLVPFFTGLLICLEIAFKKKSSENYFFKKTLFTLCSFTGIYVISTIIFWPVLWKSPFFQFFSALKHMSNYPWTGTMLYMGSFIKSTELPWHYIPVWITLTTPPLYLLFFITGSASFFIPGKYKNNSNILNDLATALWIITPVLTIIVLNSVIYDAWRHLFFIYPAIILLTLKGFYITNNFIKNHFLTTKKKRLIKNILY